MRKLMILVVIVSVGGSVLAAIPPQKSDSFPEGEKLIYSKLLQSFRKGDIMDMNKQKKLLEDNYPTSVHLDNAYYLIGATEYQQDHLGEALRAFDKVVSHYTQSSKRSAALFAMGMTYKKLNLNNQAQAVFKRVLDLYPGSPESQRAWMEIRLTEKEKKNPSTKTE
jgi:TolA-binding protein